MSRPLSDGVRLLRLRKGAHEFHATQMPPTDGPLGAVPELVAHLPEPPGMLQGVQCPSLQVSAVVLVWIVLGEITGRCCNAKEELVLQAKLRRILAMGTEPHLCNAGPN